MTEVFVEQPLALPGAAKHMVVLIENYEYFLYIGSPFLVGNYTNLDGII